MQCITHFLVVLFIAGVLSTDTMHRPVFGPGSFSHASSKASLTQYEVYVGLRFLTNARGCKVQNRQLDKYIIGGREAHIFPGNSLGNKSKSDAEKYARMDWDAFVVRLDAKNLWKQFYRMSKGSFFELLELVRPDLEKNSVQSLRSTNAGAITPELRLSITLR